MSIWPGSIASNSDLYVAVDFPNSVTALNGAINSSQTTITVTNSSNYPSSGGFILIDTELIKYTGILVNQLTGCLRGQDGTTAAPHLNNVEVTMVTMAEHHNVLKDEVIAIETSLNLTNNRAVITSASGRVTTALTTDVELSYVHGVTSSIQTQLGTKIDTAGTGLNKSGTTLNLTIPVTIPNGNGIIFQDTEITPKSVTVEAPTTLTSTYTLKWPLAQGVSDTVLTNDGSGNLSWANIVPVAAKVALTGQTSSVTTTTLFTPPTTGTYKISIYIVDTVGTTFTLQGTIGWTDDAQMQTATTSTLTNTTNGYTQSSFFIEATSGNVITYAVALTGTATYSVYAVAERLS